MRQISFGSGQFERQILIAMIVDPRTIAAISSRWTQGGRLCFRSEYARLIGGWAVEHWRSYQLPLGRHVEVKFQDWAQKADPSAVEDAQRFLIYLNREFVEIESSGKFNSKYYLNMAEDFFNKTHAAYVRDEIENALDDDDLSRAEEAMARYAPLGLGREADTIVTFDDEQQAMLEDVEKDVLVRYPGALGKMLGMELCRGNFIVFLGREKIGKTTWLIDVAFQAWKQGNRVAYFTIGDMNKKGIMRRLLTRMVRYPARPGMVQIPVGFNPDLRPKDKGFLELELREFGHRSRDLVERRVQKFMRSIGRTKSHCMRIVEAAAASFGPAEMTSTLQHWADRGWFPDVVVCDYMDLMPIPSNTSTRDGTNLNWMKMRGLNQEMNFLFVTATQADADSYRKRILTAENFSEDKRKNAHATGIIGLNQTPDEKQHNLYRLNWILRREEEFHQYRCWYLAGAPQLCAPAIISTLPQKIHSESEATADNGHEGT